jgi:putative hydroxymethylpyrimidine transport system substrate-binding protein
MRPRRLPAGALPGAALTARPRRAALTTRPRRTTLTTRPRRTTLTARPRRTTLTAFVALACALALAACGEKQNRLTAPGVKPYSVMLDFFPNADHAALYSAIAHGDFRAVGLDVQPQAPAEAAVPLKELAAGRVDMAISYEPEVLIARDHGLKVVSIAALVQRPLTSIIALPGQGVSSVADLAGKRVGTAGIEYQSVMLHAALDHAGVDPSSVTQLNVGFNLVPAMLSGRVAATLGGFWNYEAIQLEMLHKHPHVIPIDQAGIPSYDELVLVVREQEARADGQELRAFMQALTRGEHEVMRDPAAAARLVVAANRSLEPKLQLASIKRTLPAALPADKNKPFGYQDPVQWVRFGAWMYAHRLLKSNPDSTGLPPFTNEFLPGEALRQPGESTEEMGGP